MKTDLGKFLICLREENDELQKDMAKKLNCSPAFLSAIENGKKFPPKDFYITISNNYKLSKNSKKEFGKLLESAKRTVTLSTESMPKYNVEAAIALSKVLPELNKEQCKSLIDAAVQISNATKEFSEVFSMENTKKRS